MASSSTSSHGFTKSFLMSSLVTPLVLPSISVRKAHFEQLSGSNRSSPGSSERSGSLRLSGQPDSYAPQKYSPISKISPKQPPEMTPSFFLTDSDINKKNDKEFKRARRLLQIFLHKADRRVRDQDGILVIGSKTNRPGWRKLSRHPEKTEAYLQAAQKAMVKMVDALQVCIQNDCYSLKIWKVIDGKRKFKHVPLTRILDRYLLNDHLRSVINEAVIHKVSDAVINKFHENGLSSSGNAMILRQQLLRPKVTNTYLALQHKQTYDDVYAISQALHDIEKYTFWTGLSRLRLFVTERYTQKNPLLVIPNPIEFYGYYLQSTKVCETEIEELTRALHNDPRLVLSYDGREMTSVLPCLIQCRDQANSAKLKIKIVKDREQEPLEPGETLKSRFGRQLELDFVAQTRSRFEQTFRGFIESSLAFLERHFNQEITEFEMDLPGLYRQLTDSIKRPYAWGKMGDLLGKLDYLVYKILQKHNIIDTSMRRSGFSNSPRATQLIINK